MATRQKGLGAGLEKTPVSRNYVGVTVDEANLSTYTFSSVNVGPDTGTKRLLIIAGGGLSTNGINSLTIDGVSATLITDANTYDALGIFLSDEVTGVTSADLVLSFAENQREGKVFVYEVFDIDDPSPLDTVAIANNANSVNEVLTAQAGGVVFACVSKSGLGGFPSLTSGVTLDASDLTGITDNYAGSDLTTGSSVTVVADGDSTTRSQFVAATFR